MRILLTNDDGVLAPGLLALYQALRGLGDLHVVAPHAVQSGGSHSITIRHPLLCSRISLNGDFQAVSVEGTPADCVKVAVNALLPKRPDLVLSGINAGQNTGIHVLYSGTVAAAVEAAVMGLPAMAISLQIYRDMDFDAAARIARGVIEQLLAHELPPGRIYNINLPEPGPGRPRGVRVAPQSTRAMVERLDRRTDPTGREYYWLNGDFASLEDDAPTDRVALREGYVCVTPLQFNLTDTALLQQMQSWNWRLPS